MNASVPIPMGRINIQNKKWSLSSKVSIYLRRNHMASPVCLHPPPILCPMKAKPTTWHCRTVQALRKKSLNKWDTHRISKTKGATCLRSFQAWLHRLLNLNVQGTDRDSVYLACSPEDSNTPQRLRTTSLIEPPRTVWMAFTRAPSRMIQPRLAMGKAAGHSYRRLY